MTKALIVAETVSAPFNFQLAHTCHVFRASLHDTRPSMGESWRIRLFAERQFAEYTMGVTHNLCLDNACHSRMQNAVNSAVSDKSRYRPTPRMYTKFHSCACHKNVALNEPA